MNKFLTLIRRDMADNRGALIITPLVIAAILLLVTTMAALTGNARFGLDSKDFSSITEQQVAQAKAEIEIDGSTATVSRGVDGKVTITGPNGQSRTIDEMIGPEHKAGLAAGLTIGTGIASALPLAIALIAVLFVLASGLHDERKDRTILFWKSMPVSDIQTVGAKVTSVIGIGLFFAFAVSAVLQLAITAIALTTLGSVGVTGVPTAAIFSNVLKFWLAGGLGLLIYVGWALPVYGWISMVSAYVGKMPFVAAMAPLVVVPLVYMAIAFRGNENDPILQALWDPVSRLIGEPILSGLNTAVSAHGINPNELPMTQVLTHFAQSLTQPMFWIGLVVAAAFIYAASEIRRRRAL